MAKKSNKAVQTALGLQEVYVPVQRHETSSIPITKRRVINVKGIGDGKDFADYIKNLRGNRI